MKTLMLLLATLASFSSYASLSLGDYTVGKCAINVSKDSLDSYKLNVTVESEDQYFYFIHDKDRGEVDSFLSCPSVVTDSQTMIEDKIIRTSVDCRDTTKPDVTRFKVAIDSETGKIKELDALIKYHTIIVNGRPLKWFMKNAINLKCN
jgi:hypothetical protein